MLTYPDAETSLARCGWIAISRDISDHPVVGFGKPVKPANPKRGSFSKAEAWLDLLMEANWQRRRESNKGKLIWIERGQLMAARSWLANRWNWTEGTVRVFLDALERDSMIDRKGSQSDGQRRAHFANTISICNYDTYQAARELNDLLVKSADSQSTANQSPINSQTLNKGTIKQEDSPPVVPLAGDTAPGLDLQGGSAAAAEPAKPKPARRPKSPVPESYSDDFEHFWRLYPPTKRKSGKGDTFKVWDRLTMPQRRKAYASLRQQLPQLLTQMRDARGDFCPMPATWLRQGRFDDGDDPVREAMGGDDYRHTAATRANGQPWPSEFFRWEIENQEREARGEPLMAPLPEYEDA